jgi:hypothetical protein
MDTSPGPELRNCFDTQPQLECARCGGNEVLSRLWAKHEQKGGVRVSHGSVVTHYY